MTILSLLALKWPYRSVWSKRNLNKYVKDMAKRHAHWRNFTQKCGKFFFCFQWAWAHVYDQRTPPLMDGTDSWLGPFDSFIPSADKLLKSLMNEKWFIPILSLSLSQNVSWKEKKSSALHSIYRFNTRYQATFWIQNIWFNFLMIFRMDGLRVEKLVCTRVRIQCNSNYRNQIKNSFICYIRIYILSNILYNSY